MSLDSYNKIKEYYLQAAEAIAAGNVEKANKVLYKDMRVELYDESIDILFNYNGSFADEQLRTLIQNVDVILNGTIEEEEDIDDE